MAGPGDVQRQRGGEAVPRRVAGDSPHAAPERSGTTDRGWQDLPTTAAGGKPFDSGDVWAQVGPGAQVGRYHLLSKAGEGGMGVVYRAVDPRLGRHVAVKLVHPRRVASVAASARLLREARAVARLNHPNVIRILDIGEHEGQLFFAMEWISGLDLRRWSRGDRSVAEIIDVFARAGQGIAAAHAEGLVHRDFKPSNVLIGNDGQVRVLDFGLARELDTLRSSPGASSPANVDLDASMTETGTVVGTPPYMAPELHHGDPPSPATDLYAFSVSLWECLVGRRPFQGKTLEQLLGAQHAPLTPPPAARHVPPHVIDTLTAALDSDPAKRPGSMPQLLAALDEPKRRRWPWAAASALVAGLGLWLAIPSADAYNPCDAQVPLRPTWSIEAEAAMSAQDSTRPALTSSLDRLSDAWGSAMEAVCTNPAMDRAQRRAAMHCLTSRHDEVQTLVSALSTADDALRDSIAEHIARVEAPQQCIDRSVTGRHPPRPLDAHLAAQVDEVRDALDRSQLQHRLGATSNAFDVAREATRKARALGFAPLLAEALHVRARFEELTHDRDAARRHYEEAFIVAREAEHDHTAIEAAIGLGFMLSGDGAVEDAERWLRHAASLLDTYSAPELHVDLAHARASLAYSRTDYEQALAAFGDAVQMRARQLSAAPPLPPRATPLPRDVIVDRVLQATTESDDLKLSASLHNMGLVLQGMNAPDLAVDVHRRAVEVQQRALGRGHPRLWGTTDGLAMALDAAGQHTAARERFEQTAQAMEARFGPEHPDLYEPLFGIGVARLAMDEPAEAMEPLLRAVKLAGRTYGKDHRITATAAFNLAKAARASNHPEAERHAYDAMRATRVAFDGNPEHVEMVQRTLWPPPPA